ncbi:uncharacterized protein PAC_05599 [Phialocephala subalpina]|uniref:Uncharacterized protein n=1 Tax=Phialocephala subalpina TaxID=576137 RepID=A0A1L7WSF6_9HELO|nr:uncharacterized protein PAC_05599 [Phialocephala subalpina]
MCLFISHILRQNKITVHDSADLGYIRPVVGPLPKRMVTVAHTILTNNEIEVVPASKSDLTSSPPRYEGRGKLYSDKDGGDCVDVHLTPEGIQVVTPEGLRAYDMAQEKGLLLISFADPDPQAHFEHVMEEEGVVPRGKGFKEML